MSERGQLATRGCPRGPQSSGQDTAPTAQWGRAPWRAQAPAALAHGKEEGLTSKRALEHLWPHLVLPTSLQSRGGGTHRQGNGLHFLQTAP